MRRATSTDEHRVVDVERVRADFMERGVVRLDGAFSSEVAARMHEVVWRYAERKVGITPDDRATWPDGWLPISWKGLKRNPVFDALIDSPTIASALDVVFEPTGWQRPKSGVQVLLTLPAPGPWSMPAAWHMDCGFDVPTWPVPAVKLFAFFGEVGPGGGGTLVLEGSHRLVDRYRSGFEVPPGSGKDSWQPFLRRHPPLGDLLRGSTMPDGGRSMIGQAHDLDGIRVEVVELTGNPGDVVLTHLHVFHCAAPNASDTPRQMLGKAVSAA